MAPTRGGVAAVHDDVGAVPAELRGGCLADSRRGAGDQGREALEVSLFAHCSYPSRSGAGVRSAAPHSLRRPPHRAGAGIGARPRQDQLNRF